MKIIILNLCLFISMITSGEEKQFARDDRTYRPRVERGFTQYLTRSLYHTNTVSLTYDDGPHPLYTAKILDVLKKYNVKATFFVLGEKLSRKNVQHVLKRIIQEGHFLASHDWNHRNNNSESSRTFKAGMKKTILEIERLYEKYAPDSYHPEMYFRFPYGAYGSSSNYHHFNVIKELSQELYGENCINFSFWDIDTVDWLPQMSSKNIFQNIVSNIFGGKAYTFRKKRRKYRRVSKRINSPVGGGIVLMHDIHKKNIKATELFLNYARKKGIKVIPLNEVAEYSYHNKRCELIN